MALQVRRKLRCVVMADDPYSPVDSALSGEAACAHAFPPAQSMPDEDHEAHHVLAAPTMFIAGRT